jgi:hypothetical protein
MHYLEERKREWQERKNLSAEEQNINRIFKARNEEIGTIEGIKLAAEQQQLAREEIFLKNMDEAEEERRRMEKKLEKEMTMRASRGRRRPGGMR